MCDEKWEGPNRGSEHPVAGIGLLTNRRKGAQSEGFLTISGQRIP